MKLLRYMFAVLILTTIVGGMDAHGRNEVGVLRALAAPTPAPAPTCLMTKTSISPFIVGYDPITASANGTTITINSGTLTFNCSNLPTSGSASHVHIQVSGSAASYVTPALTGPSFTLTYSLCVPGAATCTSSSSFWGNGSSGTTDFNDTKAVNGNNDVPSFAVFITRQDAFVGDTSQYVGNLYFSFRCGEGSSQVTC